jgi:ABC-type phosphate/phosphonate transport system substrate-binding protein
LISVDVLDLVVNAEDRQQVFRSHLNAIQAVRFETVDVAAGYQDMANRFLDESNACLVRKEEGDRDFYE